MCRLILTAGLCLVIAALASSHQSQDPAGNSGGSRVGFCNTRLDGYYADSKNPHFFYICSHGTDFYMTCPADLVFSDIDKVCVRDQKSDPFCTGKKNGNYVNPNNRNTFYMCSNGQSYIQPCQQGLVYNAKCDCCDYP